MKNPKIGLFYILVVLYWMSMYAYQPLLSTYSYALGASSVMVGTILGAYGFAQLACRIPLGILSDKTKKRRLYVIIACGVSLLSALGMYLARTPVALLIFRGLAGVSCSAWVVMTVLFSSYFEHDKSPQAMTRIMIYNNCGMMLSTFLGGQVAQYFDTRAAFVLSGISAALALAVSFFITENVPANAKSATVTEMLSVGRDKTLLIVSGLALLFQIIQQGATMGFTPKYAAEIGGTAAQQGLLSSLSVLGVVLASIVNSSILLDRWGTKRCIMTGQLLNALGTIAIAVIARNIYVLFAFQFVAGYGYGMAFSLLMGSSIRNIDEGKRGVAMGFYQSIYALGMVIGPVLTGALIGAFSIRVSLGCIGFIGLLGLFVAYFALPKRAKTTK